MDREYKISIGMKIFYGVLATGIFVFSIFLFKTYNPSVNEAVLLIPSILILGSILMLINIIRRKVIISATGITNINVFSKKELLFTEIKGCRVLQKTIFVEPISPDKSKITIVNYDDLADSEGLAKWFKENFKDQDAIDLKEQQVKILSDTSLGYSQEEREKKLKKARYIAITYNISGTLLAFGSIFLDNNFDVILLIIYPLLSIPIMLFSKGLIKFLSNRKRSVYAYISFGIFMPPIVMLFKSMVDYDLYRYDYYCMIFISMSLIIWGLFYITGINKAVESIKGQTIMMIIVALIYSSGSVIQINCTFDNSTPKIFHTNIISKDIEYSKGNHYYVTLSPWNVSKKSHHIEVSQSFYEGKSQGDSVIVHMKKGTINIPWFYITP